MMRLASAAPRGPAPRDPRGARVPRRRPAAYGALALAAVASVVGALTVAAVPTAHAASGVGAGYWHTSGNRILDAAGNPVRIAGINWYGFETPDEVAHGLWAQDYHAIVDTIKNLGYNTIRIPFSNQMVEDPIVPQGISNYNSTGPINTDLTGLNSMQILDKIITYAGQDGLKVILDDHRSEAGESAEDNGLWYTATYTNQDWINDWSALAKRYAGNPTVVGVDLRNEPHTPAGDTYAQGATWGTGSSATDVRLAYEAAGNAVLAANPNLLVFCEGISQYPDSAASGGYDTTWWGGDLQGVAQYPVVLSSAGHVVYSAHDYGPQLFQQAWFNSSTTAASLDAVWNQNWGYIYQQGIAPVWVGEFGTDNTASDISSTTAGSQGQWFSSLVSYLSSNPWMGWTYWALNGEDSFALLDNGYDATPPSAQKQALLATIQFPLSTGGTTTPPTTPPPTGPPPTSPPPTTPTAGLTCHATYALTNSWPGGFQGQLTVANTGTSVISGWTVAWKFPGDQQIGQMWTASYTQTGESVSAVNEPYNSVIAAGSSVAIGFTGTYTSSDANPTAFTVNGVACG